MNEAPKIAGYLVLGGFLLQQILELFSQGVEHGHLHTHQENDFGFPVLVMFSLFLHSFIEGMPFGGHDDHHHHSLLLGIVMHKLPVAMVLTAVLLRSGLKKRMVVFWLVLFALMAPLGTLVYKYYLTAYDPQNVVVLSAGINALLVGVLLHVSTTILFESTDGHKFNLLKFLSIILGFLLSAFLL
jgi:zinc transporter ZupT